MIANYVWALASVVGLALLFLAVERVAPAEPRQSLRGWLFNLGYAPFILAFAIALGIAATPLFAAAVTVTGGGLLPVFVGPDSGLAAHLLFALAYAFAWDLSQYALHRLQHAVPALWETHKFHHDETEVNAAAQARVHPTSYVLAVLFHVPVVLLFGPQAPHFAAAFTMFTLWGFVNHANVRLELGPLTPLIAGPQWHRLHHSLRDEHRDRNFAVLFPVIDMAFGTYCRPRRGEFPPTGLGGERLPSLRAATVEPFVGWYRLLRRRPGRA